jgi:hypothetical protein
VLARVLTSISHALKNGHGRIKWPYKTHIEGTTRFRDNFDTDSRLTALGVIVSASSSNEMITVPIKITLPLALTGPRVLPQPQNPVLIRFACPGCGQHLSATRAEISMTAACPSCNEVITVPIQSTLPPRPLVLPQNLRKNTTWGVAVQLIGLLLCWTVVGAIVGIPLIIVGRRVATRTFICHCGNEMTKDAKICPTCRAHFP